MKDDHLIALISKNLANNISEIETKELNYLLEIEDNMVLFEDLKIKWETSKKLTLKYSPSTEDSWERLKEKMEKSNAKEFSIIPILYRVAAVLVVALGLIYFYSQKSTPNKTEYFTNAHETKAITLPDNSRIWLNESSYFAYNELFNTETRNVTLKGEAYFEVEKNAEKPFVISTYKSLTKVLGTSFNISAYDSLSYVDINVNSGRVAFSEKSNSHMF